MLGDGFLPAGFVHEIRNDGNALVFAVTNTVPLPAPLWGFAAALAGLAGVRRRMTGAPRPRIARPGSPM